MTAGQPPYYDTPEEMQIAIDSYFDGIIEYNAKEQNVTAWKHPTVTGLALALGFCSRQSLLDYERKGKFFDTVKKAKARIEDYIEQRLYQPSPTGCIFNLKNNFGWEDHSKVESSGEQKLVIGWQTNES